MTLDLALVGGGLANGLLADRLLSLRPEVNFALFEAGPALGGNHTWCFHETDVEPGTLAWLSPFVSRAWVDHDVAFPNASRTLAGRYFAIRSSDFARALTERLGPRLHLNAEATVIEPAAVTVGGRRVEAGAVIDGRGFGTAPLDPERWGFQKFLGRDVTLTAPHGLTRPILMDATVEQLDGFRFVYALPWDERRVLVEDTRYADTPAIDVEGMRECLDRWMRARGWAVEHVEREERAALPIPLHVEPVAFDRPTVGVAGGFFHATTGYSLPFAAAVAEKIAALPDLKAPALTVALRNEARRHSAGMGFFRLLNRMLFRGATPAERVRIFESFYGHKAELIERFYSGRLTWKDKLAALGRGAPTVPFAKAVSAAVALS